MLIGYPESHHWPRFDLQEENLDVWFHQLYHKRLIYLTLKGLRPSERDQPLPFLHSPPLQRDIFEMQLFGLVSSERTVLNAYMTSYFNAWLDNHNLYTGPKQYVLGFIPRMNANIDSMHHFFDVYPDGRFITLVRDPLDWFASARFHMVDPRWHSLDTQRPTDGWALLESIQEGWIASTEAALTLHRGYPEQTLIVSFEDLVRQPETVMRGVTAWLGIDFTPALLRPTFNQMPVVSNSTHGLRAFSISTKSIGQYQTKLAATEIQVIQEMTGLLYEQALASALSNVSLE